MRIHARLNQKIVAKANTETPTKRNKLIQMVTQQLLNKTQKVKMNMTTHRRQKTKIKAAMKTVVNTKIEADPFQ